jgi:hypothetical protein
MLHARRAWSGSREDLLVASRERQTTSGSAARTVPVAWRARPEVAEVSGEPSLSRRVRNSGAEARLLRLPQDPPRPMGRDLPLDSALLFQLLSPENNKGNPDTPWQLSVARFPAMYVSVVVLQKALTALMRDGLEIARAGLTNGHVIVCGLGPVGLSSPRSHLKIAAKPAGSLRSNATRLTRTSRKRAPRARASSRATRTTTTPCDSPAVIVLSDSSPSVTPAPHVEGVAWLPRSGRAATWIGPNAQPPFVG